ASTVSSCQPPHPPAPTACVPPTITSPPPSPRTYIASSRSCASSSPPAPRVTSTSTTASYGCNSTNDRGNAAASQRSSSATPRRSSASLSGLIVSPLSASKNSTRDAPRTNV